MTDKNSFSKAYQELEKINEWFQQEEIDLDQALAKFKRGVELIKICKKRLQETENEFREIQNEYKEYLGEK